MGHFIVSGGSITKRHLLSSVEYRLSSWLLYLGVPLKDVNQSYMNYKNNNSGNLSWKQQDVVRLTVPSLRGVVKDKTLLGLKDMLWYYINKVEA